MGAIWSPCFVVWLAGFGFGAAPPEAAADLPPLPKASAGKGQDAPVKTVVVPVDPKGGVAVAPAATTTASPLKAEAAGGKEGEKPAVEAEPDVAPTEAEVEGADAAAVRADASARLAALPLDKDKDKAGNASAKAWREVYQERLQWLDAFDKAAKMRSAAENPSPTPEKEAEKLKADLESLRSAITRTAKEPEAVLPSAFRNLPAVVPDASWSEMKDAIEAAEGEFKDWSAQLDKFRAEAPQKPGAAQSAGRVARDKIFQRLAGVKARNLESAAKPLPGKTPEARALARGERINDFWEARVESEKLKAQEAAMALDARRAPLEALRVQQLEAHVALAKGSLDLVTRRYKALASKQESDLHKAADREKIRASLSEDPLERYRAKRAAELLELKARVQKTDDYLKTNPAPSLVEQRALADAAQTNFTNVKKLVEDGKISHFDAIKLNNDFRRIGAERARIVRNDLAASNEQLTFAENALNGVEMELLYDSRDDRYELDNLLERVGKPSRAKAITLFEGFEREHLKLLNERRDALEKIANNAEMTNDQIRRRLEILDNHFGFIRTNLFWVRDEEPISLDTVAQAHREARQLGRAAINSLGELMDRSGWGRVSPEFYLGMLGLAVVPWPLARFRRHLNTAVEPAKTARPESGTTTAPELRSEDDDA